MQVSALLYMIHPQRTHFYLVNSSGAYHIRWYYEYGSQNKTLSKLLTKVKRATVPVFGIHNGDQVIFSFNNITYKVLVKELLPYLWSKDLLDNFSGIFLRGWDCDGSSC